MIDGPERPAFAHASEAELARILDFYAVRWSYEPDTFPIGWNLDGDVVESFSPDFYLPDLDLYVELTTLRQKLVRKKNRKLRRLRELYPDIGIKLFYARDFRMLLLKFGRLALADELSGTTGQATPARPASVVPETGQLVGQPMEVVEVTRAEVVTGPQPGTVPGDVASVSPGPAVTPRGRRRGRRRRRTDDAPGMATTVVEAPAGAPPGSERP